MSPLPQRKKSAEELAALRDQLGITPRAQPAEDVAPASEPEIAEPDPEPLARDSKPVRSLRRSERKILTDSKTTQESRHQDGSIIPARRRSEKQLQQLRLQSLAATQSSPLPSKWIAAHPVLIVAGYLSAAVQLASFAFFKWPMVITALAGALALSIAIWIFYYRQFSRHHTALIVMILLVVSAFAVLHYFPQLNYGS